MTATHLSSQARPALVRLPAALAALFPEADRLLALRVDTVGDLMATLDRRWPGMRDRLVDSSPAIRRHINVFVNGERATLTTRVPSGADVFILTSISGG